jgi:hypothetical protein
MRQVELIEIGANFRGGVWGFQPGKMFSRRDHFGFDGLTTDLWQSQVGQIGWSAPVDFHFKSVRGAKDWQADLPANGGQPQR